MPVAVFADSRLKVLDAAIRRHQASPDALIAVCHKAQELYGFLDTRILWHVARSLRLPPSRVYGVATFYHLFRLKPPGEHTCVVCLGTACFVKGAQQLLDAAERAAGGRAGQTTPDGRVSLAVARCVGTCGLAPLAVLDDRVVGPITPDDLETRVRGWVHGPR